MNVKIYIIKCFQLSFLQLLSASIVENTSSNDFTIQIYNESTTDLPMINFDLLAATTLVSIKDCSESPDCLRCNINGCLKCAKFIMRDTRKCIDNCPTGYTTQWSSNSELMGRICVPSSVYNSIQTVLIGVVCGALLCFLIVFMGVIILKRKQQKMSRKSIKDQLIDDEYDRHEFIRQLDELRPYAEYFLFILNDTRKQIRKSYISGDTTASAKYYPIIRDLAKILILLNRPVELIDGPPHDWNRLLQWADRILAQYKPQQQITQLIEFLQSPTSQSSSPVYNNDDARLVSKHTTFKSLFYSTPVVQNRKKFISSTLPPTISLNSTIKIDHNGSSNNSHINDKISSDIHHDHLQEPNTIKSCTSNEKITSGSLISLQEFINESNKRETTNHKERLSDYYGDSFEHVKNYLSKGSLLVVEDELIEFKLGLRPQDEIITEL